MWIDVDGVKYSINSNGKGKFKVNEVQVPEKQTGSSISYRQIVPSKKLMDRAFGCEFDALVACKDELEEKGVLTSL